MAHTPFTLGMSVALKIDQAFGAAASEGNAFHFAGRQLPQRLHRRALASRRP